MKNEIYFKDFNDFIDYCKTNRFIKINHEFNTRLIENKHINYIIAIYHDLVVASTSHQSGHLQFIKPDDHPSDDKLDNATRLSHHKYYEYDESKSSFKKLFLYPNRSSFLYKKKIVSDYPLENKSMSDFLGRFRSIDDLQMYIHDLYYSNSNIILQNQNDVSDHNEILKSNVHTEKPEENESDVFVNEDIHDSMDVKSRKCTICGNTYPLNDNHFYQQKSRKSGYSHYCINCTKQKAHEKYRENPDKYIDSSMEYYLNHRDEQRKKQSDYYQRNKDILLSKRKENYKKRKKNKSNIVSIFISKKENNDEINDIKEGEIISAREFEQISNENNNENANKIESCIIPQLKINPSINEISSINIKNIPENTQNNSNPLRHVFMLVKNTIMSIKNHFFHSSPQKKRSMQNLMKTNNVNRSHKRHYRIQELEEEIDKLKKQVTEQQLEIVSLKEQLSNNKIV